MAREKKPVHRVQMTEGKRNIIHQPLEEYDILKCYSSHSRELLFVCFVVVTKL